MTSVQFVVHPLPGTQEQLAEKLKSVADRLNKYGHQGENSLRVKMKSQCCFICIISSGVSAVSGIREEVKQIAGETTVKDG